MMAVTLWAIVFLLFPVRASIDNGALKHPCPPAPTAGLFACRGRELKRVPLPIGAPKKNRLAIDSLDISDNLIEILHEDALKPYPMLKQLRVENNRLWKLTELAFQAVPNLEHLYLRGNFLVIQPGGFAPTSLSILTKLKTLDISENPIGTIPGNFFKNLPSLIDVQLERAVRGLILSKDAFAGLTRLQTLSLANNAFENLPNHLEAHLLSMPNLTSLLLHGNNWNCDCNLVWFVRILRRLPQLNATLSEPKCEYPNDLHNKAILDLPLDEFQCAPVTLNKEPSPINEAQVGATINIICNFYADPRGYVRWYKDDRIIRDQPRIRLSTNVEGSMVTIFQANLTLSNAQAGVDDGVYVCEAGNRRGKAMASFPIKVDYPGDGETVGAAALIANNSVIFALILSSTCLAILTAVSLATYYYCRAKADEERREGSSANGQQSTDHVISPKWNSERPQWQPIEALINTGKRLTILVCRT